MNSIWIDKQRKLVSRARNYNYDIYILFILIWKRYQPKKAKSKKKTMRTKRNIRGNILYKKSTPIDVFI